MHIKASMTLENCVILPIFICIFMGMVSLTGYYHDKMIIKSAVELAAVKLEQLPEDEREIECNHLKTLLKNHIERKTLFMKSVTIEIEEKSGSYTVCCNSNYGLTFIRQITGLRETKAGIRENNPCNMIRIVEATMEVVGK